MDDMVKVGILGASGYTGAELVRLLARHPRVEIVAMTAERHAGKRMVDVFPQFRGRELPSLMKVEEVDWRRMDLVFCCLPHGTTQDIIAGLPHSAKVVDLSADFRLTSLDAYNEWYGHPHRAPELQKEAVYGLTEANREAIKAARLVANPGCYPTCSTLPLIPLLKEGLIEVENIVIDAKSGVSGAGRAPKESSLFAEVAEGFHAYGVASHRHAPEIEQELSKVSGKDVMVSFTPHLVPMNRGMMTTTYVTLAAGKTADDLREALSRAWISEPFIRLLAEGETPQTRHVRGSNYCDIAVVADRVPGRAILISVIDNLVKGASGQAIQNMNVMLGFPETLSLEQEPLFP